MIFDCILFDDEVELLSIRCATLSVIPDLVHVIIEAPRTFAAVDKPLHFRDDAQAKLQAFYSDERFLSIVVDDLPCHRPVRGSRWECEKYQRNAMTRVMQPHALLHRFQRLMDKCDWLLFSDADEIPRASSVAMLPDFAALTGDYPPPLCFRQRMYYYYLNVLLNDPLWAGTIAVRADVYQKQEYTVQGLRDERTRLPSMFNGGWHFSMQGGVERIAEKLRRFSHVEHDTEVVHAALPGRFETLTDPFNRQGHVLTEVPVDHTFPLPIQKNRGFYEDEGWILTHGPR